MLTILKKEINAFFGTLMAYIIIGFFVLVLGLWVWVLPECNVFYSGYADLSPLLQLAPYIFMFLCPAITMHLFSEEYKAGTLELLLTSPTSILQIILVKYFASLFMVLCMLLLTAGYGGTIAYLASPMGNVDLASWLGAYIGLTLLSALFLSIGLLASSYTANQVVAFLWASLSCFLIYQGLDAWAPRKNWDTPH
jgi:ABC-2 type transport system permease protein